MPTALAVSSVFSVTLDKVNLALEASDSARSIPLIAAFEATWSTVFAASTTGLGRMVSFRAGVVEERVRTLVRVVEEVRVVVEVVVVVVVVRRAVVRGFVRVWRNILEIVGLIRWMGGWIRVVW